MQGIKQIPLQASLNYEAHLCYETTSLFFEIATGFYYPTFLSQPQMAMLTLAKSIESHSALLQISTAIKIFMATVSIHSKTLTRAIYS